MADVRPGKPAFGYFGACRRRGLHIKNHRKLALQPYNFRAVPLYVRDHRDSRDHEYKGQLSTETYFSGKSQRRFVRDNDNPCMRNISRIHKKDARPPARALINKIDLTADK
jgi:hypothetical protein